MSLDTKYEEHSDDCNAICPYCGNSYQVEAEDYDEEGGIEKCDNCGKKYFLQTSFSVTHNTQPNCRLNGEEHTWEKQTWKTPPEHYKVCTICGEYDFRNKDS